MCLRLWYVLLFRLVLHVFSLSACAESQFVEGIGLYPGDLRKLPTDRGIRTLVAPVWSGEEAFDQAGAVEICAGTAQRRQLRAFCRSAAAPLPGSLLECVRQRSPSCGVSLWDGEDSHHSGACQQCLRLRQSDWAWKWQLPFALLLLFHARFSRTFRLVATLPSDVASRYPLVRAREITRC